MRLISAILLLVLSNAFMTFAWYGHLKFKSLKPIASMGLFGIILVSWGIAFFEYCLHVPANRMGYKEFGGPFSLLQLKVIQEVITLLVFLAFTFFFFRSESFKWNHLVSLILLTGAVYFAFKKF